jgi:hypothetical protein
VRPLKVTAVLVEPVASVVETPRLDAILESVMRCHVPSILKSSGGSRHTGADKMMPGTIPIPIIRRRIEGYPFLVPCCSAAIYPESPDSVEHFARRLDLSAPDMLRPDCLRKVDNGSGEFKASRLPLRVRAVDRIVWFCIGKDPANENRKSARQEILKLLKKVDAIGKKTAHGFGRVAEWIVEPIEDDLSWFAPSEWGPVLMRILPACVALPDGAWGYRRAYAAPVAPYWAPENKCEVFEPC